MQKEICPLAENNGKNGDNHIKMVGKDVYKYVMQEIPLLIENTLKKANMKVEDMDAIAVTRGVIMFPCPQMSMLRCFHKFAIYFLCID